jgi:uncharacterized membrane protein YeaQ/YmgE (transglycosylase-associated protein family)
MTGIEILATEQVAVEFGMNWLVFFCIGIIIALFVGFFAWLSLDASTEPLGIIFSCCIGCLCGAFFGALVGTSDGLSIPTKYETHYQVLISEEVNINEFLEQYEIIDQNGKIYTVREKN